ncbi:unnamed protein product [Cylindrotheca closterium]|uniref:Structural maintenance of chromosomes protein n=1 Tax=Cylindrotheca closterium TaxID=2856 RepID=A0AAD2CLV9_9STRA|nr:unnamed protein product [Cylindrotheca closterium]
MVDDGENNTPPPREASEMIEDSNDENHPPPRLMITKMVLENFKSYAGIKEIGPFHKCFSAVVGPNGSGKSNVIDAMLFVFGKRAKKLRLNKVSELIHKSDAVKDDPPQYARVSVHFQEIVDTGDGDDDFEIVPNTETIVTRIAKTDSSSTYKLDGRNSSFKDIATYLNSKGIDLDNNRFLILQGEVEMISMMPPKGKTENDEGLLEYLEDIIGSSKFVEATNEAAEKVDALTEVRQEKLNRVKAVEKEKDNLEGAKQEAEALLAKEREIRQKQNILYHIHLMTTDQEGVQISEKKEKVAVKISKQKEKLTFADERIEEIESGLSEQRKDYDATFNELKRTKDEFTAVERKDIKLREEIKHERSKNKKLKDKIKTETKKETTAAKKREKAIERIPLLEEEIQNLVEERKVEDEKLERIEEETKASTQKIRRKLEVKTEELAPVKQQRAELQASLETAETELKLMKDSTDRAQERLQSAEEELAALDETQDKKRNELQTTEKDLSTAKITVQGLHNEDKFLIRDEESLGKKQKEYIAKLEDVRSAMRSTGGGKGRSKATRGIIKAAKKGGELSGCGVLGRLGDLATVPAKYDVAVSTACGMLDHIVVQTTAGAQRCLEFLRKHNLGRASFIPLDKQKKGAHDRAVETPEGAPRLFELIVPSNFAVTPALYLAVGNTLVAPDLETASRWAYDYSKRWRVVTLDGKLIETAGTMSGGGKAVRRGGMRLADSRSHAPAASSGEDFEAALETLEKENNETNNRLQECRKRRLTIKDELRTLSKTIKTLEIKMPKLRMEIAGCDTTREELTKLVPELREQTKVSEEDAERLLELSSNVGRCTVEVESCAKRASALEKEVSDMQNEILKAGGTRMKNQKATCDKIVSQLNEAEKKLNSSNVEIKSTEKAVSKAKAAREGLEKELAGNEELLEEKQKEFKALEAGAFQVMTAYEQVKVVEEKKRLALEKVSKEVEDLKASQSEVRCVEIDLLGQLDALEKQCSENKKKKRRWHKEIEKLRKVEKENEVEEDEEVEDEVEKIKQNSEDQAESGGAMDVDEEKDDGTDDEATNESSTAGESESMLSHSVLEQYKVSEVEEAIETLRNERSTLARNANMGAITEYKKKEADYLSRVGELDQVTDERNEARRKHEELRRERLEMFMEGFGAITLKLKEMYQMITLGGDAELELVDSLDPFSEGIVFSVRPPKKSWKNISNLSGGEKTLSSLSLVFALHHYKPTPLYVMDEIDAALDFKNVSIVANYIKERTKNAQFIIISLRNNMFELADRLVGIYKTNNCTKSVTINPKAFGVNGKQNGGSSPSQVPLANVTNRDSAAAPPKTVVTAGNAEQKAGPSVSTSKSSPFFSLDNSSPTFFQSRATS